MIGKPVSAARFDAREGSARIAGSIDSFRSVNGIPDLGHALARARVPRGAPVAVAGWAVDLAATEPPEAVKVVVDGAHEYAAQCGLGRYDVKALLGPQTPEHVGFRALVATEQLAAGPHELRARARAADGEWYDAAAVTFWIVGAMKPELPVDPREITLRVDGVLDVDARGVRGPLPGVVSRGNEVMVHGWAFDAATMRAPAGVCVLDASGWRWNGVCNIVRADVIAATGTVGVPLGFEVIFDAAALRRGAQQLTVWAFGTGGQRLGKPTFVDVDVTAPVRLFPGFARERAAPARAAALLRAPSGDTPLVLQPGRPAHLARDERVVIEGWAYSSETEKPGQIVLELQPPVRVPPFRYHPVSGYVRCAPLRELPRPARDDAWFSYALDPSNLATGSYRLSAAVLDEDGGAVAHAELATLAVAGAREPRRS